MLLTEFRAMTLNDLFCADVLWPLDLMASLTLLTNRPTTVCIPTVKIGSIMYVKASSSSRVACTADIATGRKKNLPVYVYVTVHP